MAVTPDMIAVALGVTAPPSDSTQFAQWSLFISDAENAITWRAEALGIITPIDEAKLDYVVREAVVSHVRHPDDATQVSTSVDDSSVSRTYRSGSGRIQIRDEWWALLGLTASSGRAFSLDLTPTDATTGTYGVDYVWISTTETGPVL